MATVYKRTAHRWNLIALVTGAVVLAAASFWLLQLVNRSGEALQADANKNEPDYIVENFSIVRMSAAGVPRYIISGAKLTHRPVGDWSDVEAPLVQNLEPGRPPMVIKARRARILHDDDEVHLLDKVRIERAASAAGERLLMGTEALTVYPDQDLMRTALPVRMEIGGATVTGTGMTFDNAKRTLNMASRGRAVYPPKPR
ncbi:LPS export ABC transporter periplasmic protein LptC [Massilia glaciei]|uniref:LPS export ABC transporter periplasmic protein LptC n=1 Tax=Massilia glaciei TaxID=1524097 RepID=A0A2U2I7Q0_9BURK|nr:LPS export ABC transporter periplasmic protein LptC [Massilia glaciei]PWF55770.1 LPS export ABC transporter periplasmic protein LptC [Massilia glaciei]